MQMEDVYRIDQGIERYMTKTPKENSGLHGRLYGTLGGLLGGLERI